MRAALRAVLAAQVARHAVVVRNVVESRRFVDAAPSIRPSHWHGVRIAVVLPMLREEASIAEAVDHFRSLLRRGDTVVLVTTEREEKAPSGATPALAQALADGTEVVHVHLDDAAGRKGDQINVAAQSVRDADRGVDPARLVVLYDADSRPPRSSLQDFAAAATKHPDVSVFHQSAVFEVRDRGLPAVERAVAQAGALRANRFVLAYELPRLRSRGPGAGACQRLAAAATYGHVSGHGLGVRLPFLMSRPMPARTPMEDMHYSFDLAVDGVPVVALRSLDRSEVPPSWRQQFRQAERWFLGPGRALAYLRRSGRTHVARKYLVAGSALLFTLEWLSCAVAIPALAYTAYGRRVDRLLVTMFLSLYAAELLLSGGGVDASRRTDRIAALAAFPLVNTGFGVAGWSALAKRMTGRATTEKTER